MSRCSTTPVLALRVLEYAMQLVDVYALKGRSNASSHSSAVHMLLVPKVEIGVRICDTPLIFSLFPAFLYPPVSTEIIRGTSIPDLGA